MVTSLTWKWTRVTGSVSLLPLNSRARPSPEPMLGRSASRSSPSLPGNLTASNPAASAASLPCPDLPAEIVNRLTETVPPTVAGSFTLGSMQEIARRRTQASVGYGATLRDRAKV